MKLKYVSGPYPTTLQMYFDKYDENVYLDTYNTFKEKYGVEKNFNYKYNENHKFYLNFSAFVILDENNKIVELAFDRFGDFVWILSVMNIDGIEFEIPDSVPNIETEEFNFYEPRFVKC